MITKDINSKLKEYFFLNPTARLRVRQIEREAKAPLPSVIRYTKELETEGILKSSEVAGVKVYSADRESKKFLLEKKLFNVKQLFSSNLVDFLIEKLSNPTIIVFGSYSKGEDLETSDIDLYIESPEAKKIHLDAFEKILQRKIQLFSNRKISDIRNKELANNVINGLVLNGFLEVFK